MLTIEKAPQAAAWTAGQRRQGRSVGLVPTMGALHEGHLGLVRSALEASDVVAVSIFVNPLQFNDPKDLERYPRRVEDDLRMLEAAGCNMVFLPSEDGIYAGHTTRLYDLGGLDEVLEGPLRPGHFQGVVNAVERLFHYVRPDSAYFGEKDRQQLTVIRHVASTRYWPVRIVGCPTVRAPDGLALSSRNQLLSADERAAAPVLRKSLARVAELAFRSSVAEALQAGEAALASVPVVHVEYLVIAHSETLRPLHTWEGLDEAVVLVAARLGPVRLIDNITLHR